MKKILLALMFGATSMAAFSLNLGNVGWMPNLGAGVKTDLGCLADSKYGTTTASCPSKNLEIQSKFNSVVTAINNSVNINNNATATAGFSQPESVVANWSSLDNKARTAALATYGFNFQNNTLKPYLTNVCKSLSKECANLTFAPKAKDVTRALEKNPTDGAAGNLDYSRATIVTDYNNFSNILVTMNIKATDASSSQTVAVVKNRLMYPTSLLYRDLQILLKDKKTGFISELLVLGPQMAADKNGTVHALYETIRSNEASIDAIKLDADNKGISLSNADNAQIAALQQVIDANKANTLLLQDYIFRVDAATSCGATNTVNYANCTKELAKYVNKPNF